MGRVEPITILRWEPDQSPDTIATAPEPPVHEQGIPSNLNPSAGNPPAGQMPPAYVPQVDAQEAQQYQLQVETCAQGKHAFVTNYGVCGIISAVILFPFGLLILFADSESKCVRCGTRVPSCFSFRFSKNMKAS